MCADVIPVHLDGHLADMPAIGAPASRTAPRRGGASVNSEPAGTHESPQTGHGGAVPGIRGSRGTAPEWGRTLSSHRWSS